MWAVRHSDRKRARLECLSSIRTERRRPDATVELGRSSVNTIEIVRGLKEGDQVILSDMSRYDNQDRIKLDR